MQGTACMAYQTGRRAAARAGGDGNLRKSRNSRNGRDGEIRGFVKCAKFREIRKFPRKEKTEVRNGKGDREWR